MTATLAPGVTPAQPVPVSTAGYSQIKPKHDTSTTVSPNKNENSVYIFYLSF